METKYILILIYVIISIIFSGFFCSIDIKSKEHPFTHKILAGFIWPIFMSFVFFRTFFKNKY